MQNVVKMDTNHFIAVVHSGREICKTNGGLSQTPHASKYTGTVDVALSDEIKKPTFKLLAWAKAKC